MKVHMHSNRTRLGIGKIICMVLTMFATHIAMAVELDDSAGLPGAVGRNEVLNVATSLALIVFVFLLMAWLFRRAQFGRQQNGSLLKVLATEGLGQRERIMLVEVAEKQLLLGVTATQIQTLYVLEQPLQLQDVQAPSFNFAERLQAIVKGDRR